MSFTDQDKAAYEIEVNNALSSCDNEYPIFNVHKIGFSRYQLQK